MEEQEFQTSEQEIVEQPKKSVWKVFGWGLLIVFIVIVVMVVIRVNATQSQNTGTCVDDEGFCVEAPGSIEDITDVQVEEERQIFVGQVFMDQQLGSFIPCGEDMEFWMISPEGQDYFEEDYFGDLGGGPLTLRISGKILERPVEWSTYSELDQFDGIFEIGEILDTYKEMGCDLGVDINEEEISIEDEQIVTGHVFFGHGLQSFIPCEEDLEFVFSFPTEHFLPFQSLSNQFYRKNFEDRRPYVPLLMRISGKILERPVEWSTYSELDQFDGIFEIGEILDNHGEGDCQFGPTTDDYFLGLLKKTPVLHSHPHEETYHEVINRIEQVREYRGNYQYTVELVGNEEPIRDPLESFIGTLEVYSDGDANGFIYDQDGYQIYVEAEWSAEDSFYKAYSLNGGLYHLHHE